MKDSTKMSRYELALEVQRLRILPASRRRDRRLSTLLSALDRPRPYLRTVR